MTNSFYNTPNGTALTKAAANVYTDAIPSQADWRREQHNSYINDMADSMSNYIPAENAEAYRQSALNGYDYGQGQVESLGDGVSRVTFPNTLGYRPAYDPTYYWYGAQEYIKGLNGARKDLAAADAAHRGEWEAGVGRHLDALNEFNSNNEFTRNNYTPALATTEIRNYLQPVYDGLNTGVQNANNFNPDFSWQRDIPSAFNYAARDMGNFGQAVSNDYKPFIEDFNNVYMPSLRPIANSAAGFADDLRSRSLNYQHNRLNDIDNRLIPAYARAGKDGLDLIRTHVAPAYMNNIQNMANMVSNDVLPAYNNAADRFMSNYRNDVLTKEMGGVANALASANGLYDTATGVVNDFTNNWRQNPQHAQTLRYAGQTGRELMDRYRDSFNDFNAHNNQVNQHMQQTLGNGVRNLQGAYNDVRNSQQYQDTVNTATSGALRAAGRALNTYNQNAAQIKNSPEYSAIREQAGQLRDKAAPLINTGRNMLQNFRNRGR